MEGREEGRGERIDVTSRSISTVEGGEYEKDGEENKTDHLCESP